MSKNGYLERQKKMVAVYRQAEKETYIQFMTDMLILTLNDPEIMGKDVFGKKRIEKVIHGWERNFDAYHGALEKGSEADVFQTKLDNRLKDIFGEADFHSFEERYEWLNKQVY